jgi:nickel transport protein
MKAKLLMPLVLLTTLGLPAQVLAHSVQTDYLLNVQKDLEITSTFSTEEPLQNAKVQVFAPGNPTQPWAEGKTDAQGRFIFEPDKTLPGEWEVRIGEGGHMDILTVPVGQEGVNVEEISNLPRQLSPKLLLVGAACLSGGLITLFLRSRPQDH